MCCRRPVYAPNLIERAYEPLQANVQLLVAETSTLCVDYLGWKRDLSLLEESRPASALMRTLLSLENRAQMIISSLPPRSRPGTLQNTMFRPLPSWIEDLIIDPRAPALVHTYSGFGPCFFWNTIRIVRIRLHQLLSLLSDRGFEIGMGIDPIKTISLLEEEISSSVCAMLLATDRRDMGKQSTPQDVPGLRPHLLVLCLHMAKMALSFLVKRNVEARARLTWLDDLCTCLRQNVGVVMSTQVDPLSEEMKTVYARGYEELP